MKFWSILLQISVTNFVLPTSSEVTPSNSTHFDRLENLLDAVDSKVERDDYYEDDYGLVFNIRQDLHLDWSLVERFSRGKIRPT